MYLMVQFLAFEIACNAHQPLQNALSAPGQLGRKKETEIRTAQGQLFEQPTHHTLPIGQRQAAQERVALDP
jgi:hypothetical protein